MGMCVHKSLHGTRIVAGCDVICVGHGLFTSLNIYPLVMSLVIRVSVGIFSVDIVLVPFLINDSKFPQWA